MNWDLIYSLKIGVAVLGAFLSLPLVEHNRKRKPIRAVAESLMSVLAAVAIVEKFLLHHSVLWCALWGGVIGVAVGYSWDALRAIAPKVSMFMLKLAIKRAIANLIGAKLPDEAFEITNQKSNISQSLPDDFEEENFEKDVLSDEDKEASPLDEKNDRNAIGFLEDDLKPFPPRPIIKRVRKTTKEIKKYD